MTTRSFEEKQDEEVSPHSPPPSYKKPFCLSLIFLQARYRVDTDFAASVRASAATSGVAAAAVVTADEVWEIVMCDV